MSESPAHPDRCFVPPAGLPLIHRDVSPEAPRGLRDLPFETLQSRTPSPSTTARQTREQLQAQLVSLGMRAITTQRIESAAWIGELDAELPHVVRLQLEHPTVVEHSEAGVSSWT